MSDAPGGDPGTPEEVADLVRRARGTIGASIDVQPLEDLPPTKDVLAARDLELDIKLKRTYAISLLCLLAVQLLIANGVFVAFAWVGADWELSAPVIDVWLGATLVEVVAIVLVVTRYLFPRRDTFG